ncbi:probable NOT transcription complex subunit VIP2 [Zingiber officinale]|uniref:probable NOT transcription complex subunit VIP2 n=1 Tax=Zingiber officinale TaxID=94328 RepID=UPI001C4A7CF2|nr:probable NOT transcription complex subunit VIP2 [Zingiber officinale]
MTRSGGFSLGGTFQSNLQQQQLHTTTAHSGELPFATGNTQDLRSHDSDFFPSHGNYHSQQLPPDLFGMLGLLSVINMNDPDLTSLSLGIDLTTVGLSLSSTDSLYKTFGSPWSDEPAKGELEYCSPTCYYAKTPPPLHQLHFSKFQLSTLFYIFYKCYLPTTYGQSVLKADQVEYGSLCGQHLYQIPLGD